ASDPGFLADTLPTLAEHAEAAGISTVGVSASPLVSRATNLARGFESFVEFSWDRARHDWPPAAEVNARFLAWLERNRGLRFLAYLHYMDPHDPYTPPAALRPPPPAAVRPATPAGLLGAAPPRGLPGRDLLAAGAEAPAISETLYGLMPDGATTPIVSLRTADWKLIHAPALGRYELYDLRRDPAEREDRFAS